MREPTPLPEHLRGRAFSRRDAERAGIPAYRMRRRDVRRPFHGVQLVGSIGDLRARCHAYAVRLKPGQAYSHATAVLLHGLPLPTAFEEDLDLHVCAVLPAHAPTTRGIAGHRLRIVPTLVDLRGIPVVDPVEAWAQMAPLLTLDELIELGDAVLWQDPALLPAMHVAAEVRNRPSGVRLRRALREIRVGAASPGETRVRLLLTRHGNPEPELNAEVPVAGTVVHPDLVWRGARVLLEYEGEGWTVIRVGALDLHGAAGQALVRRVRTALGC